MIKLVSFVVFVSAFVWTWFLFNSQDKINLNVHAGIQSKLILLIEDSIKKARPNSSNFEVVSVYTQKLDDNKIKAHFSYKYNEKLQDIENATQSISGEAILNRTLSENVNDEKWIIQSIKTDNSSIEFQQGLVISSGSTTPTSAPPSDATKTAAKTKLVSSDPTSAPPETEETK